MANVAFVPFFKASLAIWRHYREEAAIASMTWKISLAEIQTSEGNRRRSSLSKMSLYNEGSQTSLQVLQSPSLIFSEDLSSNFRVVKLFTTTMTRDNFT